MEKITNNIDLHLKKGESEVDIHIPINKSNAKEIDTLLKESKEDYIKIII